MTSTGGCEGRERTLLVDESVGCVRVKKVLVPPCASYPQETCRMRDVVHENLVIVCLTPAAWVCAVPLRLQMCPSPWHHEFWNGSGVAHSSGVADYSSNNLGKPQSIHQDKTILYLQNYLSSRRRRRRRWTRVRRRRALVRRLRTSPRWKASRPTDPPLPPCRPPNTP